MTTKVIQWATGGVGKAALRVILTRGDLELVGVYVHSTEKVGVDAGTLSGLGTDTGIVATDDAEALIAAGAECLFYTPLVPDIDMLVRFLEAGIDVVTTSDFFRGDYLDRFGMPDARARLDAAGKRGNASVFGGGYNPGFITMLPIVCAQISAEVDLIEMEESADIGHYGSGEFFDMLGWGKPVRNGEATERSAEALAMDGFMYDALDMIVEACRFEVTDRIVTVEYATTSKDLECTARTFRAGTVAGRRTRWEYLNGDDVVIRMNISWFVGRDLEPNFAPDDLFGRHKITVHGNPGLDMALKIRVPEDRGFAQRMDDSMIGTAMTALNAVPHVRGAAPGVRSYLDMPLFAGIAPTRLRSGND